jgi:hypothetical protein
MDASEPGDVVYVGIEEVDYEGSSGHVTIVRVPEGSWRKRGPIPQQLPLTLGQLEPYMREGLSSSKWRQLNLPFPGMQ